MPIAAIERNLLKTLRYLPGQLKENLLKGARMTIRPATRTALALAFCQHNRAAYGLHALFESDLSRFPGQDIAAFRSAKGSYNPRPVSLRSILSAKPAVTPVHVAVVLASSLVIAQTRQSTIRTAQSVSRLICMVLRPPMDVASA